MYTATSILYKNIYITILTYSGNRPILPKPIPFLCGTDRFSQLLVYPQPVFEVYDCDEKTKA
jgi:hypothetical protein